MVARLRRRGLPVLEGSDLSGLEARLGALGFVLQRKSEVSRGAKMTLLEALAAEAKIPLGPGGTVDCIALMCVGFGAV